MKIYIAGPYTKGDTAVNVRNSIIAADAIRARGHTPYNPLLTHFWHLLIPHEIDYWYAYDLEWLAECDAILRLPGDSTGAEDEIDIGLKLNMKIFYSVLDIPQVGCHEQTTS